jgi:hypothetical protein
MRVLLFLLLISCSSEEGFRNYSVQGQLPGTRGFRRLPDSIQVSDDIKKLGTHSSGISVRFKTNSPSITFRWALGNTAPRPIMAGVAVKGLDVYAYTDRWQFVGVCDNPESSTISGMDSVEREYMVYLPLYSEVETLDIEVSPGFRISKGDEFRGKPIIIYGTSITQGASASRPGMSYTSILSRNLNREVINLGFSGNGFYDPIFSDYLLSCDPAVIVLDCTPNSLPDTILTNLPRLISNIRDKSNVPILLIESITREDSYFKAEKAEMIVNQNKALRKVYEAFNDTTIYYLQGDLIGHEATVDGTHLTDVGMARYEEKVRAKVLDILDLQLRN